IWLGGLRLTDYNFFVGFYLEAAALAALAAGLIFAARRLRGRTSYADAFFPLAVLNFGQGVTYIWWWQVNTLRARLSAGVFLILVVRHGATLTFRPVLAAAACLALFPFCGPHGLPYAVLLAPWFAAWAVSRWHAGTRHSLVVLGAAA